MNIFYVDHNVFWGARAYVDSHVNKMVLEYAQIMSNVHRQYGSKFSDKVYKITHKNNPFIEWAGATTGNYSWLAGMWIELHREFCFRFGKTHKSFTDLSIYLLDYPPLLKFGKMTPPHILNSVEPAWIVKGDPQETYRNIYRYGKIHLHSWTGRNPPKWITHA